MARRFRGRAVADAALVRAIRPAATACRSDDRSRRYSELRAPDGRGRHAAQGLARSRPAVLEKAANRPRVRAAA